MGITAVESAALPGLSDEQVLINRNTHGRNSISDSNENQSLALLKGIVLEPMFVLLLITSLIYLVAGNFRDAIFVLFGLILVSGISFIQERKSKIAINSIRSSSAPKVAVIRNGRRVRVPSDDIVVNDIMMINEGDIVEADGIIMSCNDLSANEAILTGESWPISKDTVSSNLIYKGTMVLSGSAIVNVTAVGPVTRFGQIKRLVREQKPPKTALQLQLANFLKFMLMFGGLAFVLVFVYNLVLSGSFISALLTGLTLAMSIFPEEIPVAVATFQALGAFKLLKKNVIVKEPRFVETLGSATTICVDKTGTLTQNLMTIAFVYDAESRKLIASEDKANLPEHLVETAMWASERQPFDPMEKSIHKLYELVCKKDLRSIYRQVHEYPLSGHPPIMTHIQSGNSGDIIIAAKGAPEALIRQSRLTDEHKKVHLSQAAELAKKGYRVLGVGAGEPHSKWPEKQEDFIFDFYGFLAFFDPPKQNIPDTVRAFTRAGIKVKMITGDYPETSMAVARNVNLSNPNEVLTGVQVINMPGFELRHKVTYVDVFARMNPEAKVKVIQALIDNGEMVAMTGDGVNDGPSLKAAHIGVAMGLRGSEVAKNAAAIIITDDDVARMLGAIEMGRKIYDNLQKAIRYIVSIHIPIILIVVLPLLLNWKYSTIFTPVHVIFLELIMGPTCSIIYENEPVEPGILERPPRAASNKFLSLRQLFLTTMQGLAITAGCLGLGYWYLKMGRSEDSTRTIVFITLLFSNLFLTLVNRSFVKPVTETIKYKNKLMTLLLSGTLVIIAVILFFGPATTIFELSPPSVIEVGVSVIVAFAVTAWIEPFKMLKQTR
ncbi:MAG: cation-translocating P-type ATPase [Chitinophagaceae bacterium]|nr:cation-translocating P-type ATPase [Chitinophagaceae bacterium]